LQQQVSGPLAEQVAAELRQRDQRDRTRANSPLVPASDAMILDSTDLGEDEVLARIGQKIQEKLRTT
jgi:cytidylate kinase